MKIMEELDKSQSTAKPCHLLRRRFHIPSLYQGKDAYCIKMLVCAEFRGLIYHDTNFSRIGFILSKNIYIFTNCIEHGKRTKRNCMKIIFLFQ